MTYLFSVITMPFGFQNNVIYTGTGLQAGGGLDGFAIWRRAVLHLAGAALHFHISTLSAQTALRAMKSNTSQ